MKAVVATLAVLGFIINASIANAWGPGPVTCSNQTISDGSTVAQVTVPRNTSCTLTNVTVTGSVRVEQGASLTIDPLGTQQVTIDNNLTANGCKTVVLGIQSNHSQITIGNNVRVQNCTGDVSLAKTITVGGNVACSGNAQCVIEDIVIQGNLSVDNNGSSTNTLNLITGVTVGGNVDFSGNIAHGVLSRSNVINDTTIGGNLSCFNNNVPANNGGSPGSVVVSGNTSGQCVGL
jgi:hypothetical protein